MRAENASNVRFIGRDEVTSLLRLELMIPEVGRSLVRFTSVPPRIAIADGLHEWLVMPGIASEGRLVCKIANVSKNEGSRSGGPTVSGAVLVFSHDGRLTTVIDGARLTELRTAAAAAYATDWLARSDASVLALFGVGALAEPHVDALNIVRPLTEIRVVARGLNRAKAFARRLSRRYARVFATDDPREALDGAELVTTVTTSAVPVFPAEAVRQGVHINAMGSYLPEKAEIPVETIANARIVVETRGTAWLEAGDLLQARAAECISSQHIAAELAEREEGRSVRQSATDITIFKSVGNAAFDLAAVELLLNAGHQ